MDELMVTITLAEYRDLVAAAARAEAEKDVERQYRWRLEGRIDDLEKKIQPLIEKKAEDDLK